MSRNRYLILEIKVKAGRTELLQCRWKWQARELEDSCYELAESVTLIKGVEIAEMGGNIRQQLVQVTFEQRNILLQMKSLIHKQ